MVLDEQELQALALEATKIALERQIEPMFFMEMFTKNYITAKEIAIRVNDKHKSTLVEDILNNADEDIDDTMSR